SPPQKRDSPRRVAACSMPTTSGEARSMSAPTSGPWQTWRRRPRPEATAARPEAKRAPTGVRSAAGRAGRAIRRGLTSPSPAEQASDPALARLRSLDPSLGVNGLMDLEPLPVIGQAAREEHLAGKDALARLRAAGLGPIQRVAVLGAQLRAETVAHMAQQVGGDLLELLAILVARRVGRGTAAVAAGINHQREA